MTLCSNNDGEKRLPVSTSVVAGHMDVPHCDAPSTPEELRFYDDLKNNDEYQKLVRSEKLEGRYLEDEQRILGRKVFEVFEHVESIREKRQKLKKTRNEKWELYDEVQSSNTKANQDE